MISQPGVSTSHRLVPLDWESRHFGFPVAILAADSLDDHGLAQALTAAFDESIALVVWSCSPQRRVPSWLLNQFHGALVDRKATFAAYLEQAVAAPPVGSATRITIEPYRTSAPSTELVDLAIAAGEYSRFRLDPEFPAGKFEAMYRIWIERSVRGELADAVLVARPFDAPSDPLLGMVTVSASAEASNIGLIAVAAAARGLGVGTALMAAAHAWMKERESREARVVTQLANVPACRLYERSGYRLACVQHFYHFWTGKRPRSQARAT